MFYRMVFLAFFAAALFLTAESANTTCPQYDCGMVFSVTKIGDSSLLSADPDNISYHIEWHLVNETKNSTCHPLYYAVRYAQLFEEDSNPGVTDQTGIDVRQTNTTSFVLPQLERRQMFQACAIYDDAAEYEVDFDLISDVVYVDPSIVRAQTYNFAPSLAIVLGIVFGLLIIQCGILCIAYCCARDSRFIFWRSSARGHNIYKVPPPPLVGVHDSKGKLNLEELPYPYHSDRRESRIPLHPVV